MKGANNVFKGFVFINFDDAEKAEEFMQKEYICQGQKLDCRLSSNNIEKVDEWLQSLRAPTKLHIDTIPNHMTKEHIEQLFSIFGKIEDIILTKGNDEPFNYASLEYREPSAAKNCMNPLIKIKSLCGQELQINYARPKFS